MRNGTNGVRTLTVVDERPEEVPIVQIELSEAQEAVERLMREYPEVEEQQRSSRRN